MTPERWARVGRLFDAADELPAEGRKAFLEAECSGDPELRAEVESLLASLAASESFLASPIAAPIDDPPPRHIGPWEVIEEIGRGGMGVVFRARRTDQGFERLAAVKLVKRGMDTDFVLRRFERERRILAALDHPRIARVLDGGSTEDGLPYFVMELIEGENVLAYAERCGMGLAERIELFRQVCSAVEYAHRHLVIHRDIKPSNVLVTRDGTVKLLDFGLAKILGGDDEAGERTRTMFRLFTPEYASPEQVRGETLTTASDVYSLGVVLYELLTGSRPYRLETGGAEELRGAILSQDPPRPSTKARLPKDVDAIVLTALRKDPARRYASVEQFGDDLRRWLEGLPVRARPDRFFYRARRFAARHRTGMSASLLVVSALFAALGLSLRQTRVAQRERDRARIEAAKDQQVSAFLRSLFESSYPMRSKGRVLTAQDLLDAGAERVDRDLAGQPELRASMLALLGSVYTELGLFPKAQPLLERSLSIRQSIFGPDHPDVAESLNFLGRLRTRQARYEEGRILLERAVRIRERKPPSPALAEALSNLGGAFKGMGQLAEARRCYERAVAIEDAARGPNLHKWLTNLASVDIDLGDYESARRRLERALEIGLRRDGKPTVQVDVTLLNLAEVYRDEEEYVRAFSLFRQALAIDESAYGRDAVGYDVLELGLLYLDTGDLSAAREYILRAREIDERQFGPEHPFVAGPLDAEGRLLVAEGRAREAVPLFERALGCWRRTLPGEVHPETAPILVDLAEARLSLDGPRQAEPLLREALAIQRRALPPGHPELVRTLTALGRVLVRSGRSDDARALFEEAVRIARLRLPERHSQRIAAEAGLAAIPAIARAARTG